MRIGVTGGAGFIGGHVLDVAHARGHEVVVFDHLGRCAVADQGAVRHSVMLGDVRDPVAVTELAAHVDGIIHLAACLGTQETIGNPRPAAATNVEGTLNVLEALTQYDLPGVYAGVGNHWMRNYAAGTYTISKSCGEDFVRMFDAYRGGRCTVVRPMNAYGPRQSVAAPYGPSRVRKILPAFTCRALTGAPIEVYGDGTQVSDCVFVTDVATAFVVALEHTAEHGPTERPVEVGPATSVDVNAIATLVTHEAARHTGTRAPVTHLPMRPGEVPNAVVSADVSTLAQIGMDADEFVSLGEGIRRTVDYFATTWLPGWTRSRIEVVGFGIGGPAA